MTKCYIDSVLIEDDAVTFVVEPGVFGTSHNKKNCGTGVPIRKNFILFRKTSLNDLRIF